MCPELGLSAVKDVLGTTGKGWVAIISHSGIRGKKHHLEGVLLLRIVVHICKANTWEAEAGRLLQVKGQPDIQS